MRAKEPSNPVSAGCPAGSGTDTDAPILSDDDRRVIREVCEDVRECLAKGWSTPTRRFQALQLEPCVERGVRTLLHQRGIWRNRRAA